MDSIGTYWIAMYINGKNVKFLRVLQLSAFPKKL